MRSSTLVILGTSYPSVMRKFAAGTAAVRMAPLLSSSTRSSSRRAAKLFLNDGIGNFIFAKCEVFILDRRACSNTGTSHTKNKAKTNKNPWLSKQPKKSLSLSQSKRVSLKQKATMLDQVKVLIVFLVPVCRRIRFRPISSVSFGQWEVANNRIQIPTRDQNKSNQKTSWVVICVIVETVGILRISTY